MDWTLKRISGFDGVAGPVVVCVMDGVGIGAQDESDAVWLARTPNLDHLSQTALSSQLIAHGTAVGMPANDDMGNSEVGHNALGAGRIFDQGSKLVGQAIASGSIFTGEVWQNARSRVADSGEALHFIGLLSDGNVHSHVDYLFAMLRRCHAEQVKKVRVHIMLDGRDVPATSALDYVDALEALLAELSNKTDRDYRIASGGGRMHITMDRYEADWAMLERGWNIHVHGQGRHFPNARSAIECFRSEAPGIGDQNLPAFVVAEAGEPVGSIRDGASVILFNYRGDRAIQICQAFEDDTFDAFDRGQRPDVYFAGMMQYDGDLQIPQRYLVDPPMIDRTLGEYLVRNGVPQFAISETQKFGHVTFFWNGNRSGTFDDALERYVEIPGHNLPFEECPWMCASEITDAVIAEMQGGKARHIRLNYANGDMVGHTGHRDAAIRAVEAVDLQIGRLIPVIEKLGGALIVTADHGNADCMYQHNPETGEAELDARGVPIAMTSHTLNPVPLHILAPGIPLQLNSKIAQPGLDNLAATVMALLGYQAPEDYGASLLDL